MPNTPPARIFIAAAALAVVAAAALATAADDNAPKPGFSLAKSYDAGGETALADYWVSEKYDGVRALWDGKRLVSRGGKVFAAPEWFVASLPAAVVLDGELWLARGKFEETTSIVRPKKPHQGWRRIRYMVFDLPEHGGMFRERYAKLQKHFAAAADPYWRVVKQRPVTSAAALEELFKEVVDGGGEGLMLRRIDSFHKSGRGGDLLKYKPFADAEAVVIGHNPGKGKYAGMTGSLRARALDSGKVFSIGSGLSDAERQTPPPVGATVTYKYQGLTQKGIPRFPVFLRIRADEPE